MIRLKNVNTDEQNKHKVSASYGKKIIFGAGKREKFQLNKKLCGFVKKFITKSYSMHDERCPLGICSTGQTILYEHEKEIPLRSLPVIFNYEEIL